MDVYIYIYILYGVVVVAVVQVVLDVLLSDLVRCSGYSGDTIGGAGGTKHWNVYTSSAARGGAGSFKRYSI